MDETRIKLVNIKPIDNIQITKPTDCIDFMKRTIGDMSSEFFAVIYLNNANEPMCFHIVSKGGWKAALVDPKEVFTTALLQESPKIMFFHNHPSGHVEPSMNDYSTTNKLASGAKIFEIDVLDHIIVSQNDFYSFAAHDDIDPDDKDYVTTVKELQNPLVFGSDKAKDIPPFHESLNLFDTAPEIDTPKRRRK